MVKTLIIGFCLILSLLIWRQLNKEYKLPEYKEPDFTYEWNPNRIRDLEFQCKQLGLSLDRSRVEKYALNIHKREKYYDTKI